MSATHTKIMKIPGAEMGRGNICKNTEDITGVGRGLTITTHTEASWNPNKM